MKWCQLFLFFLLVAAFIPSRNKYLSWDSSLICLYPKLIESNDVNWLENAAWDENKLKGNWCQPSRTCARRDRRGWESKTQVITDFVTTIGCWKWRMGLEKHKSHFSIPLFASWPCQYFAKNQTSIFRQWWRKQNLLENFPRWACQEPMTLLLRKHKHELWGTERNFMTQTELDRGEMKIRNHGKDLI